MGYAVYGKDSSCTCGLTQKELADMKRESKKNLTADKTQHNQ